MPTQITDHVDQALARRTSLWTESDDIEWFLSAAGEQIQELEDTIIDLVNDRWLSTAEGAQLDLLGGILNIIRNANTDDEYRRRLKAAVVRYKSSGRAEEVISAFILLVDANRVILTEVFPAEVNVAVSGSIGLVGTSGELENAINDVLAAGVSLGAVILADDVPFVFQGYPFPEGKGYSSIAAPASGGRYATLL